MILRTKAVWFFSSVGAGLLALGAGARANDLPSGQAERAQARCDAAYGPGFTAIEGGEGCVWVGGHVRVGFGRAGAAPDTGFVNGSAVRVNTGDYSSDGVRPMTGHLRLRDGDMTGTIAR